MRLETKLFFSAFALMAAGANAQAPDPTVNKNEMKKLSAWVGHWSGESTSRMGPGEPQKATVNESIQFKLDNTILLVEGIGKSKIGNGQEVVVHEALGVLFYNQDSREFRLRSHVANGRSTDAWFKITGENEYQWGFDTPQGKIRYSIQLDLQKKTWYEKGEFSTDGNTWYPPFLEMNLTKEP